MSFIATAPTPSTVPPTSITNDGFFPDIDLAFARESMRLDGTVTDPRLRHALIGALLETGNSLAQWKAVRLSLGYQQLAEVPSSSIDGKTRLEHAYLRAIFSLTQADLIERMPDYDTTAAGQKRAEWLQETPEDHRRNARWAIADLLGLNRTTVELI